MLIVYVHNIKCHESFKQQMSTSRTDTLKLKQLYSSIEKFNFPPEEGYEKVLKPDILISVKLISAISRNIGVFTGTYKHLVHLNLCKNDLTEFCVNLPQVKSVELSDNKIKVFDSYMPEIEYLQLGKNEIETLHIIAPKLTKLYLFRNPLKTLTGIFSSLRRLYAPHCLLETLPLLPVIRSLDVDYNNFRAMDGNYPLLESLWVEGNPLWRMTEDLRKLVDEDERLVENQRKYMFYLKCIKIFHNEISSRYWTLATRNEFGIMWKLKKRKSP